MEQALKHVVMEDHVKPEKPNNMQNEGMVYLTPVVAKVKPTTPASFHLLPELPSSLAVQ